MTMIKLLTGLLLLTHCAAHAGVIYNFSGSYANFPDLDQRIPASFTLIVPDFISADTSYAAGPNLTCNACSQITLIPDAVLHGLTQTPSSAFLYWPDLVGNYVFYFEPGALLSLGPHQSIFAPINSGVLTLTETPEPNTFWPILALVATPYFAIRRSSRR
jgi:hypothetical protein